MPKLVIPMPDPAAVGQRVRALRMKRGWTLLKLRERSGVNLGVLSLIEHGRRSPSARSLVGLGIAFRRSLNFVLFGDLRRRELLVNLAENRDRSMSPQRADGLGIDAVGPHSFDI